MVTGKSREKLVRLKKGRQFHKKIQKSWRENAQGKVKTEKLCIKPSGRKGRMDIHVDVEGEEKLISCVEIKASDWDKMTEKVIRRNVKRQIKQVWDYIESELARGKEISPGIVFPKRPRAKKVYFWSRACLKKQEFLSFGTMKQLRKERKDRINN